MRRIGLIVGGISVLLLLGYFGVSASLYSRLATVAPQCEGQFTENTPAIFSAAPFAPDLDTSPYFMPDYQTVTIPSRQNGITLSGWYVPGDTDKPVILIVHGLGAGAPDCKRHPRALLPAGMLHQAGYNVLLIDLRNHGDSTIDNGMWGGGGKEYQDVLGAWDWLQTQKGFQPNRVGLFAYSGGTAAVLIAMGQESRIPVVWLDSPFVDIADTISDRLAKEGYPRALTFGGLLMAQVLSNDNLEAFVPGQEAAKLNNRPAFIVHCEADATLSVEYAYKMASILRLPADRLWIAPGCDHVRAVFVYMQGYEQKLIGFFDQVFH